MTALVAFVAFGAGLADFSGFSIRDLVNLGTPTPTPSAPDIKVYFSGTYSSTDKPKSDFELKRGQRTLLFVRIPQLKEPVDRVVFGTAFVRAVNIGSRSMPDIQFSLIFANKLWHPSLGDLDQNAISPSLTGPHKFNRSNQRIDDRWLTTLTLPRLDPMSGAPLPVSFLLQLHAGTPEGELNVESQGEIEIRMFGPDWVGLTHVLDIRCIPADSAAEFVDSCRTFASALRSKGYPDVPVVLAETGGQGIVPVKGGPTIIQAKIDTFIAIKGGMLHDF